MGVRGLGTTLQAAWEKQTVLRKSRAHAAMALLASLNPLAVLGRGYSITRRKTNGLILRRAGETAPGQEIDIRLASGNLSAVIIETYKEPSDVQGEV